MADNGDGVHDVGVRSPDGYEKKYMSGTGMVLHREKSVAPWYFHILFVLPALATLIAPWTSSHPDVLMSLALTVPFALFLTIAWLLFAVLRATVTQDELHIQYGLFGPKIPIAKIKRAEAVDYDWKEFGGWGIRRSFKDGAWIYNMWGDKGRAARVTYEDEAGKDKTVVVGCARANLLIDAVRRAQLTNTTPAERKRVVDAPKAETVEFESEVQDDAIRVKGER